MKPLRAAVIGLGFIGPQHIDAIRRVPLALPVALCDNNADHVRTACEQYGVPRGETDWREVLHDPTIDVIHNCTPNALHDEINRQALLCGKHVYSEKPLSMSAQTARELWKLACERKLAAGLNHQYRMNAAVQEMRARLLRGLPGRALMATGCYLQESASRETDWSQRMENTGISRTVADIGVHWVDTACAVLGEPVSEVFADLHTHYPTRTGPDGTRHPVITEDTAFILVRFKSGLPGQFTVSKAANGHKNDLRLNLWCEGYGMEWRQEQPDRLVLGKKETGYETIYMNPRTCQEEVRPYVTTPMGHVMGWPDALRNSVAAFSRSILDGSYLTQSMPCASFRDGFLGMAFIEACVRSSHERRWVEVEQL